MIGYSKLFVVSNDHHYQKNIKLIANAFGGLTFVGTCDEQLNEKKISEINKADTLIFDLNTCDISLLLKMDISNDQKVVGVGGSEEHFLEYTQYGIDIYFEKRTSYADLLDLITNLRQNKVLLDHKLADSILKIRKPASSGLTNRELEVLRELGKSKSYSKIGESLYISVDTVKSHLKNIYSKLNVGDRFDAVERARTENYI